MPANLSSTLVHRVLREPTAHFLVVAALVFAFYTASRSGQENILEIDPREIEARVFLKEITTGEPVSEAQRQAIAEAYIEEQMLVREALAMELDNDARIHDMLAQKMRHVLSGGLIQPLDSELESFYAANRGNYRVPATLSADELVFNQRDPLAQEVLARLQAGADAGELLAMTAGSSGTLRNAIHMDLAAIFSDAFADQVFAAPAGQWQGPFMSNRGQHWLRVTERDETRIPALAEISDRVRLDWIAAEEEARLREEITRLREQYTIVMSGGDSE